MLRIVYTCDECGEEFGATAGIGFPEAWQEASAEGWTFVRIDGVWKLKCEKCNLIALAPPPQPE